MIIYSNGCSHTAPNHPYFVSYIDIVSEVLMKENEYESIKLGRGVEDSVSSLWHFNNEFVKDPHDFLLRNSQHGKSNDLIFFETYNVVKYLLSKNIKLDYAIIQFSGLNRRFQTTPEGKILDVNPFENFDLGVKFEPIATEQSLQYMLILQDLFKSNDIKYCFIPYMEFDSEVLKDSIIPQLIDNDFLVKGLEVGCRNKFRIEGKTCDAPGHPNTFGYYELAKLVLEKFNLESKLKTIDEYFELELIELDTFREDRNFIKLNGDILGDGTDDDIENIRDSERKNLI